jgi:flagellar hook assembly protein FlgD
MHISFALPSDSGSDRARVRVFDVSGRLVKELVDGKVPTGELQQVTWDGKDEKGKRVSSGIYYVRLESRSEGRTVKAVFAR